MSTIRLTAIALAVSGCAKPGTPIARAKLMTLDQALSALKSSGFTWESTEPLDKGDCRTDNGCVEATLLRGFKCAGPASDAMVQTCPSVYGRIEKPGFHNPGNVFLIFGTELGQRPSYEDETAATSSVRKAFDRLQNE